MTVNKTVIVNITGSFEAETLRVLRQIPGLEVLAEPGEASPRADATLGFAGSRARIAVEIARRANAATAWQLVRYAEARPDVPHLLIANETTAQARKILAERGIGVIDGLGNAHIALPGLLFHLEGHGRGRWRLTSSVPTTPPTRLTGKAGVVAQALLIQRQQDWHVGDLAKEAKVSPALAHRVLARLEKEGIMVPEGAGPKRLRRVINPTALLDLWAEENNERPIRMMAHVLAQTPQQLIENVGKNLGHGGFDYALTGAAGASLVAPFVTAVPVVEVWVPATAAPGELSEAAQAERVTEGHNVVFLQAKNDTPLEFRQSVNGLWVANPFRLYADLLRDPRRGREQADHLREEVIGF